MPGRTRVSLGCPQCLIVAILLQGSVCHADSAQDKTLDNFRRATSTIFSGGRPEGAADYECLKSMGVRTLVSVDASPPDQAETRRLGLASVHVPIGYGGVEPHSVLMLEAIAAKSLRPIYVFCHHGRHRGPAAAALIGRADGDLDQATAVDFLHQSGTSERYVGLWRDVAAFKPAPLGTAYPDLISASDSGPLALAMTDLDRLWRRSLEASEPDDRAAALIAANEALRESRRAILPEGDKALLRRFQLAADRLRQVEDARNEDERIAAEQRFESTCISCHAAHRD